MVTWAVDIPNTTGSEEVIVTLKLSSSSTIRSSVMLTWMVRVALTLSPEENVTEESTEP